MDKWKEIEAKLHVADIILAREKKFFSRMIRKATNSYWSHVMIVFSVDNTSSFKNILVISAESRGIEIHRLQKFSRKLDDDYDLGVKRFPGLTPEDKQKILSYMLNNVDTPYDYLRLVGFLLNYILHFFRLKKRRAHLKTYLINKNTFICTSFIQKAFFAAVTEKKKNSVLFSPEKDARMSLEEITPADIARSENFEWIYNPHL